MRKAQVNVAAVAFLILFGMIFLGFVFYLSTSIKDKSSEHIGGYIIDSIFERMEQKVIVARDLLNSSQVEYIFQQIDIPKTIGDEEYKIWAYDGKNLVFQSFGSQAFYKKYHIYWWPDVEFNGSASSTQGYILLNCTPRDTASGEIIWVQIS